MCMLTLSTACGSSDVPRCGDERLETLVTQSVAAGRHGVPLRWGVPFRLADHTLGVAIAEIDVGKLAKALHFTFSDERERGYDPEAKKRSCTAELSSSWDGTDPNSLITVVAPVRKFTRSQEALILSVYFPLAKQDMSQSVEFQGFTEPQVSGIEEGTLLDTDDETSSRLKAAFAGAMPRYLHQLFWAQSLNYTGQLTEKGQLLIKINE